MVDSAEDSKMDKRIQDLQYVVTIYLAGQQDMLTHNNYTV